MSKINNLESQPENYRPNDGELVRMELYALEKPDHIIGAEAEQVEASDKCSNRSINALYAC